MWLSNRLRKGFRCQTNLPCNCQNRAEGDAMAAWMHSETLSFYLELQTTTLLFFSLDLGLFPGWAAEKVLHHLIEPFNCRVIVVITEQCTLSPWHIFRPKTNFRSYLLNWRCAVVKIDLREPPSWLGCISKSRCRELQPFIRTGW